MRMKTVLERRETKDGKNWERGWAEKNIIGAAGGGCL